MSYLDVASRTLAFEPPPGWALIDAIEDLPRENLGSDAGVRYWLSDAQARIGFGPTVWMSRSATEVVAPDGLQRAATCEIIFDPTCQKLVVHFVRIIRGNVAHDIDPTGFQLFRREADLERAKFDGRLTAHLAIPDVRVGDLVDVCYSVIGEDPLFGGRFAANLVMQWSVPVACTRFRLLASADRPLKQHFWNAPTEYSERTIGGETERIWVARRLTPCLLEPGTPSHWIPFSRLFVGDDLTWAQVAELYGGFFPADEPLPSELAATARDLAAQDEAGRIATALRLVQREIRYLAISIGPGGLTPRAIAEVWKGRFGDCKDVSQLLSTLLRAAGVDAVPALVSTGEGLGLDQRPPAIGVFDHCIVRVKAGGKTYWFDPTRSVQAGKLDKLSQARFGWALPLAKGATLEPMGEDEAVTVLELDEVFTFGWDARSSADLTVKTIYRAWRADLMRQALANDGHDKLARQYKDFYHNNYGELEATEAFRVVDRPDENELETYETYRLNKPWTLSPDGKAFSFTLRDQILVGLIGTPRTAERRAPIFLGAPRKLVQRSVVNLPFKWNVTEYADTWAVGPLRAASGVAMISDRVVHLETSASVTGAATVPPEDAARLFDIGDQITRGSGMIFSHPAKGGAFDKATANKARNSYTVWLWIVGALVVFKVIGLLAQS